MSLTQITNNLVDREEIAWGPLEGIEVRLITRASKSKNTYGLYKVSDRDEVIGYIDKSPRHAYFVGKPGHQKAFSSLKGAVAYVIQQAGQQTERIDVSETGEEGIDWGPTGEEDAATVLERQYTRVRAFEKVLRGLRGYLREGVGDRQGDPRIDIIWSLGDMLEATWELRDQLEELLALDFEITPLPLFPPPPINPPTDWKLYIRSRLPGSVEEVADIYRELTAILNTPEWGLRLVAWSSLCIQKIGAIFRTIQNAE